jgi:hypothetical protein
VRFLGRMERRYCDYNNTEVMEREFEVEGKPRETRCCDHWRNLLGYLVLLPVPVAALFKA